MDQLTRDNHYVPQFYLKYWSPDKKNIWVYRTLVSHNHIPEWSFSPIRGTAVQRDLYTSHIKSNDNDDFERWVAEQIEGPVQEIYKKIWKDNKLSKSDWDVMSLYFGLQDVRTLQAYKDFMQRWSKNEEFFDKTISSTVHKAEKIIEEGRKLPVVNQELKIFKNSSKIDIVKEELSEEIGGYISAKIVVGRELWLETLQYLCENSIYELQKNKWCIVKPFPGYHWITSDRPAIKVNYNSINDYEYKGGWRNPKSNLLLPLTPRHLMFAQVGDDMPDVLDFDRNKTKIIQKLIARGAHKFIFAKEKMNNITKICSREVDFDSYKFEENQWKNWHQQQNEAIEVLYSE